MEPIATYSEVRFDGARVYTLLPEKILVRGKVTLHSDFESEILLTTLDPNFDRISVRNRAFGQGLWMALASFVTCIILVTGLKLSLLDIAPAMLVLMGGTGLILSAVTCRKVEFFNFKNHAGITVLDVARSGKQAAGLDSFLGALTKQIRVARGIA